MLVIEGKEFICDSLNLGYVPEENIYQGMVCHAKSMSKLNNATSVMRHALL